MSVRDLVTTSEGQTVAPSRVLLKPRPTPARVGQYFQCTSVSFQSIPSLLSAISRSEYLAVDFETRGGEISDPTLHIIGIGLAWDTGSCYLHWSEYYPGTQSQVRAALLSHPGLLAHNVGFDGRVMHQTWGVHGQWAACTLATYKYCSNEGWLGQRHGLKEAMVDILQWENSNETELEEWLITNGHYLGNRRVDNTPETLLTAARDGKLSANKGEMWRAPKETLGKYCVLDAEACYLLWTEHFLPVLWDFPALAGFLRDHWMPHILTHIEQSGYGIPVDRAGLQERASHLDGEIARLSSEFRHHPDISQAITEMETAMLMELQHKQPEQYIKQKPRPPEPPRFRKDGVQSKAWENWVANEPKYTTKVLSANWENWNERMQAACRGENPEYRFNLQSDQQMRELLYGRLGNPVRIMTDSGLPGTGVKALRQLGALGKLLVDRAYAEKELSYVSDYIHRTQYRPTIHPTFHLPGTTTGRLSSARPNLQQVPKSKAVMSLFQARPGTVWVDLDFAALESVVAAELSRDPALLELYGDGVPENDIHLYVAAQVPGEMGEAVLATGYRPSNPPPGSVARAKKEAKKWRSIAKTVVYACQFGAGVAKVMESLEAEEVYLPEDQVAEIHGTYWKTFARLKQYGWDLQREWRRNGGYVLNGFDRPMCVTEDYKKDLLSRVVQSTGHDLLVLYCSLVREELNRALPGQWKPTIWDWHDAVTVEVPEAEGQYVASILEYCVGKLNEQVNGTIQLRGKAVIGRNLSEVKEPEE